ncbi:DUF4275 family protein [Ureibacillus manganicus]|uniref:ATP synthase F1 subunit delta n=1 Tax=Ureibacillus manganicus DSM 26584 TaxID=1384049 RepID=A0A0A3HYM5_9BACL|nr:DUF4275 family protein [Ureibacillus manganicus]KGR77706.1 ATP synthase F1 subunit delta [Ureibacillus manganicus DSM 26584]
MEHKLDLVSILKKKNVKVTEIHKWGTYLRKQFEVHFADHLSEKEKRSIFLHDEDGLCGFLWHIFSYEKKEHLNDEQADFAFENLLKQSCFVFYQNSNDAYILDNAYSISAKDFGNEEDIYIVDKDFNWTYVRTHETGLCGPYFCQKS